MKTLNLVSQTGNTSIVLSLVLIVLITASLFLIGCKEETIIYGSDDLSNPAVQPRVVFTSPANNSAGPYANLHNSAEYHAHFIVRFNKLMRKSSFMPGTVKVQGFDRPVAVTFFQYYYYRDQILKAPEKTTGDDFYNDFLEFSIRDSLNYNVMSYRVGQTYVITIDSLVEDINGNRLSHPFSFFFTPEPVFRIVATSPKNGSTNNDPTYNYITILFNSPVDTDILSKLQISPSLNGGWAIPDGIFPYVTFSLASPFPFNSEYTVTVDQNATDVYHNQLQQSFSSSFSIAPFRIRYSYPRNGQTEVDLSSTLYVHFNGRIDTSSIRPSLTFTPNVTGVLNIYYYGFDYVGQYLWEPSTTYTMNLSTGVTAFDGTHLSSPATITFTTTRFRVNSTTPYNGETNVERSRTIYVGFNTAIDTGSVRSAFSISPAIAGYLIFDQGSRFSFYPSQPLDANTTYAITISTAMKTKSGKNLQSPVTFSFTTVPN